MTTDVPRQSTLRWIAQGATVLLVLVAVVAAMLYLKVGELESSIVQIRAESEKRVAASAATASKAQAQLNEISANTADMEQKQRLIDSLKTLLAKVEPQVSQVLEAAGKTGRPDARAAVLAGAGLVGQFTNGAGHAPAIATLNRALALDKTNCVASLAINLSGTNRVEVSPDCQALLPSAAADAKPAADAKSAADAKPTAETKPAAAPAGEAAKAVPPAGKS